MKKIHILIIIIWLIIISYQYYYSKTVTRFFPELVLPSFPNGAFNSDTVYQKTYLVEIDYVGQETKVFNYQEFLIGLPESTRINSFKNIFEKSYSNLHKQEVKNWYKSKANELNPSKKAIVLRVNKVIYRFLVKDYKCENSIVSKENFFLISFE
ncbi:MAG: hypothetical protein AB7P01_08050 [Bacteroidia bacterium]